MWYVRFVFLMGIASLSASAGSYYCKDAGYILSANQAMCMGCPASNAATTYTLTRSPDLCSALPAGYVMTKVNGADVGVKCDSPLSFNAATSRCEGCPTGFLRGAGAIGMNDICYKCPSGASYRASDKMCVAGSKKSLPTYAAVKYATYKTMLPKLSLPTYKSAAYKF